MWTEVNPAGRTRDGLEVENMGSSGNGYLPTNIKMFQTDSKDCLTDDAEEAEMIQSVCLGTNFFALRKILFSGLQGESQL